MSTVPIHPIEYFKTHLPLEGTRLITDTAGLFKRIFNSAEPAAKVAVVVLTGALIVLALSTIGDAGAMTSSFCDALPKVVFTL